MNVVCHPLRTIHALLNAFFSNWTLNSADTYSDLLSLWKMGIQSGDLVRIALFSAVFVSAVVFFLPNAQPIINRL